MMTEQINQMNAEFSAQQIGKQDTSVLTERLHAAVYFWAEECNYLSATAAVDVINQLNSQLETIQCDFFRRVGGG